MMTTWPPDSKHIVLESRDWSQIGQYLQENLLFQGQLKLDFISCVSLVTSENYKNNSHPLVLHLINEIAVSDGLLP